MVSPYARQDHPDYWPDPELFDPERFTPQRSAGRSHYANFPFSSGLRMCIGSSFAMMETQLILATIAQRYQLGMVPGHLVELQLLVTLLPKYGLPMTIHERKRKIFFRYSFHSRCEKGCGKIGARSSKQLLVASTLLTLQYRQTP